MGKQKGREEDHMTEDDMDVSYLILVLIR